MFGGLTSGTHGALDPQQRPMGPVASGCEQWVAMRRVYPQSLCPYH